MDLLTIKHQDFTLSIECTKFDDIWKKAKGLIGEEGLFSIYSWSEGVVSAQIFSSEEGERELKKGEREQPVFFDNADYPVWAIFNDYVEDAQFGSVLQSENERFSFRNHILAGFINYGNDIGRSEMVLIYKVKGKSRRFTFTYDVLSTKLDYHEHWRCIIEDIEREYRMLSLDYLKRTFHGFSLDSEGSTPDIVWWSVFAKEQENFIKACKLIIDRPRRRLHGQSVYKRADQLTFVPTGVENELAEHRQENSHLYLIQEKIQTNDTQENRFLKFAITQVSSKYEKLRKRIDNNNKLAPHIINDIHETGKILKRLKRHPFFRTIGRFKGMSQESLVLQKATGYSQVYRTWCLLRRGYSLNDGIYRLQTKDIATLYEIWCLIEVSHIVQEQLHLTDEEVEHRNRMEMNSLFSLGMEKGEHSRILYRKDNVELAELVYNPKSTDKEDGDVGLEDVVVPTVPQKPDIVLQLTKNDLHTGMKMTYLFDAKYRIKEQERNNVDTPPDDAINQMHRYRDAIYYKEHDDDALKKEVIGGYILFPGDGNPLDIQKERFYKSIEEVNIGAFPLRPKDKLNRKLLEDFIAEKINAKGYETIAKVIPQKGAIVEVGNRVLIGLVKDDNPQIEKFRDGKGTLYSLGESIDSDTELSNLHYFMPYIEGFGIRDVYEIIKICITTENKAKKIANEIKGSNSLHIAFELRFSHRLSANFQLVKGFDKEPFLATSFEKKSEWLKMNQL